MGPDQRPAGRTRQAVPDGHRDPGGHRGGGSGRSPGAVLGAATLTVGLVAGLFFDWAVAIMPSLARTDDQTFVVVMRETVMTMNGSPLFLLSFMGALLLTAAAVVLQYRRGARASGRWVLAALALYVVAAATTMGVHLPLNDTLESAGDPDRITDLAALRRDVETEWVNAHLVRTVAAVAALACLCRALWLGRAQEFSAPDDR
jgi:uncharacterized membrane protein